LVRNLLLGASLATWTLLIAPEHARAQDELGSDDTAATVDSAPVGTETPSDTDAPPVDDEVVSEEIDVTRLDVERLPPEAIEITRDLYSHGLFVEGFIGGRGFVGGIGNISVPGPYASIGFGLELFNFLYIKVAFEGSIHETDAPPPPSPTVFELLGALVELKLQLNVTSRVGLWLQGEFGGVLAFGDVLPTYGVQGADEVGMMYGGSAGFDWHLYNRHYSVGFMGGARLFPSLETFDGGLSLGIHGALYLRYVI
jgi:hypothetical protein